MIRALDNTPTPIRGPTFDNNKALIKTTNKRQPIKRIDKQQTPIPLGFAAANTTTNTTNTATNSNTTTTTTTATSWFCRR